MNAVQQGAVLAGKYRVDRILGQGGMGVVVAATHLQLDKKVALKFLLPHVLQNAELVARFGREARAASKIESEHIAKVSDVGTLENGAPYMVMEYLEGHDLAHHVKTRGKLSGNDAIEYVLQACEALAEAHVAGIVHRDLKPANLFLTHRADGSPSIKVLDFGISKIALEGEQGQQGMTQTSAVMGSPSYMAPEQLKSSRNVDARTDIWSLGIILYELLTGQVAFKADTVPELYVSILSSPAPQLRALRADAPAGVEAIVYRCLEKDPARRFANVGEFAYALREFAPPRAHLSVERVGKVIAAAAQRAAAAAPPGQIAPAQMGAPPAAVTGHHAGATPASHPSYAPAAPPGGPGQSYASGTGYGQAAPQAYGQQQHYGRAQSGMHGYHTPQPQGYAMAGPAAQPSAGAGGMSTATIVLIVLVAVVVLSGGGCMMCLCIGAAANGSNNRSNRRSEIIVAPADERLSPSSAGAAAGGGDLPCPSVQSAVSLLPFQPQAGWTRLSPSAGTRPPFQPASPAPGRRPARAAGEMVRAPLQPPGPVRRTWALVTTGRHNARASTVGPGAQRALPPVSSACPRARRYEST